MEAQHQLVARREIRAPVSVPVLVHLRSQRRNIGRMVGILPDGADFELITHALERGKCGVERRSGRRRRVLRIHRHEQHAFGTGQLELIQHVRDARHAIAHGVVDEHRVVVRLQQMPQRLHLLLRKHTQRRAFRRPHRCIFPGRRAPARRQDQDPQDDLPDEAPESRPRVGPTETARGSAARRFGVGASGVPRLISNTATRWDVAGCDGRSRSKRIGNRVSRLRRENVSGGTHYSGAIRRRYLAIRPIGKRRAAAASLPA